MDAVAYVALADAVGIWAVVAAVDGDGLVVVVGVQAVRARTPPSAKPPRSRIISRPYVPSQSSLDHQQFRGKDGACPAQR